MIDIKALEKISSHSPAYANMLDALCRIAPPGAIVECGVYRGGSAAVIISACEGHNKIYLCDSFEGFPDHTPDDIYPANIKVEKGSCKITIDGVKSNLQNLGLNLKNVNFVPGFFEDSMPAFAEVVGPIALLHFDADFYNSAKTIFQYLLPKLVKGAFVVIHDYYSFLGVKKAVDETFDSKKLTPIGQEGVYYEYNI